MIAALLAAAIVLPNVPGAYNHSVTQATVSSTVCVPGWSAKHRPPFTYTNRIKRDLLHGRPARDFQLDHLVSLSLGGAPYSRLNLWLEPIGQALRDDQLEWEWHRMLCAGTVTLRQVRRAELRWKRVRG
jgi:hypothetical protein